MAKSRDLPLSPSHPARALPSGETPSPEPAEASSIRKRRHPNAVEAGRPHSWGTTTARGQPAWVNQLNGSDRYCTVCGVTERASFIMADHAGMAGELMHRPDLQAKLKKSGGGQLYVYLDAKNNQMVSLIPLGCPVFMLDHKGTTMENRERIRQVDDRVDGVEDRVDDVVGAVESVEARLARLEAENAELRARVDAAQVDVTEVVNWLAEMVAYHAAQKLQTVTVEVEGRGRAALPPPIADLILNLGQVQEREPVPVILDAEVVESHDLKKRSK